MEVSAVSVSHSNSESSELNQSILNSVQQLAMSGSQVSGRALKPFSKSALSKLATMPLEKKQQITQAIAAQRSIVLDADALETPKEEVHDEWRLILKALDLYGLHLKDDFKSVVHHRDVIEIYNADHLQIFRTFNFYEYSAYSYLDLLMNEWFHLWERPKSLLERLFVMSDAVAKGKIKGIHSMNEFPEHVYKEIYNSEDVANFEVRSVLCKFGSICPLYKDDGEIGGFIVNCRVKVLGMGEETQNLSFL